MEVVITNKAAYLIILFLILATIGIGVNARVDLSKAYHILQDIVRTDNPTKSVDLNANGIIDEANEALSINWHNLKDFQKCEETGPNDEDMFAVGYAGILLDCRVIGLECTGLDKNNDCSLKVGRGSVTAETGLSVLQNFNPEHVIEDSGSLWITLIPEAEQFAGGIAAKLTCLDVGNCPTTSLMYNIPSPRQIDTYNGDAYVGTDQTGSGKFYKIGLSGCVAITNNIAGNPLGKVKGVVANAHGIFALDEMNNELLKYTTDLVPVEKRTIINPQYATEGFFGGETKIIVMSQELTESHIKIYDAATLTEEADLTLPGILRGIALDDTEKTLFIPGSGEVIRYSLDYSAGTYTLGTREILPITHNGIKSPYANSNRLYLPEHLDEKVSIYTASTSATPTLLTEITTADLSGTMLTCDETTLCGPITANGQPYPPRENSQIGTGMTTTPQNWQYVTGTPGTCQFTCTGGKTYVQETNACGETWHLIGTGTSYNCADSTELVTYDEMQVGESCNPASGDSTIYYCSQCNNDQTDCDYEKFECKLQ